MSETFFSASHYDLIVVGGRPAGATLAARLGQPGLRVLLLERATFPSVPAASSPVIYPATMQLLDQIGADEREYARGTPQIRQMVSEVRGDFCLELPLPNLFGRDYMYAIDRARFDAELWRVAASCPTVTALQGWSVTDLLRDPASGAVCGVAARPAGGAEARFSADCVVGADGRFSLVARKASARTIEERADLPTSVYYAYWKNVRPYDTGRPLVVSYGTSLGYGLGLMNSADGSTCVVIEGQASVLELGDQKPLDMYMRLLKQNPRVWPRLSNAEPITDVRGMRNIGNLFREAGGPGWALVGDALHQKDPLDGQGIYDAVITAKLLAEAILSWKRGDTSWPQALEGYAGAVRAETYPMFQETMARVKRELYTTHPDWAYGSWLRWLATDPEYKRRIILLLSRGIDPNGWLPPKVFFQSIARGALADLAYKLARRPHPHAPPPLREG